MEKSIIYGVMLQHADGDKEFYTPKLSAADQSKIYKILDKYGDDNESQRGELETYDAEKVTEAARRLYAFMDPWERCETTEEETAEEIRKNPIDAIIYLLEAIEN